MVEKIQVIYIQSKLLGQNIKIPHKCVGTLIPSLITSNMLPHIKGINILEVVIDNDKKQVTCPQCGKIYKLIIYNEE